MPRIKKETEPLEDKFIKVKRVLGQKVNRVMDTEYFREFPEIYENLMRYNIVELPESLVKELKGIKVVDDDENFEIKKEEE